MKCPDCKQKVADTEIVQNERTRIVCGDCKRKAYVVYPTAVEEGSNVLRASETDAEGRVSEVPEGDVHSDEAAVSDA